MTAPCCVPKIVFGQNWSQCPECDRFPAIFKEIATKNKLDHAHIHAIDLIMHLGSCQIRKADVRVNIEFDKQQLIKGYLQSDMAKFVRPSIWFHFADLCNQLRRLSIPEFLQIFLERIDRDLDLLWNDIEVNVQCHLLGLIDVMPVQYSDSPILTRDSLATATRTIIE